MLGDGSDGNVKATGKSCGDLTDIEKQGNDTGPVPGAEATVLSGDSASESSEKQPPLTIVVTNGESYMPPEATDRAFEEVERASVELPAVASPRKGHLSRNESSHEQCRVCQQEKEEELIDLGCHCRGELAKAHRSCIDTWFRTKGSNKCEICQQAAVNVAPPEVHQPANYWVWRVDPSLRGSVISEENRRGCLSPLWVAFSILIGGLLLDVLISVTLGVSALPVNIIIGVIVVLGLGTALRLALEFFHEWRLRRVVQRVNTNVNLGYHPAL